MSARRRARRPTPRRSAPRGGRCCPSSRTRRTGRSPSGRPCTRPGRRRGTPAGRRRSPCRRRWRTSAGRSACGGSRRPSGAPATSPGLRRTPCRCPWRPRGGRRPRPRRTDRPRSAASAGGTPAGSPAPPAGRPPSGRPGGRRAAARRRAWSTWRQLLSAFSLWTCSVSSSGSRLCIYGVRLSSHTCPNPPLGGCRGRLAQKREAPAPWQGRGLSRLVMMVAGFSPEAPTCLPGTRG